ncbi:MAG TPA: DUF3099 domain-containing protein [Jatrophihabitans sp.]|jgi:hypothetical protein
MTARPCLDPLETVAAVQIAVLGGTMDLVRPLRHQADRPFLITEARLSNDDEFDRRRKRYLIMMSMRAVCIVAAAVTFRISGWLAAAFVVGALVLPWTAVLIANDRPPKQGVRFRSFRGGVDPNAPRELTMGKPPPDDTEPAP